MTAEITTEKELDFASFIAQNEKFKEDPKLLQEYLDKHLAAKDLENHDAENAKLQKLLQDENFKKDISSDQDLTIALMNLIGIEEHLFFTGAKTEKHEYYDLITVIRDIRKSLLGKIIKEYEGEVWCISKHLLASSYRLMEVGTKQLDLGKNEEAYELFDQAFSLYCLFWGINKKIFTSQKESAADQIKNFAQTKKKDDYVVTPKTADNTEDMPKNTGIMGKLKAVVKKVVDCCIE